MIDKDNYIQRQAAFLFDKGLSPDAAHRVLMDKLGKSYQQQANGAGTAGGPIILALTDTLKAMNINDELIFMAIQKLKQDAADVAQPVNKYLSGVIASISAITAMMLFLLLLASTKLLPIFEETFTYFGNELPPLTKLVLDSSLIYLMVLVPLAILVFLVVTSKVLKNFYLLRTGLPSWMLHVPALRTVAETLYLWVYLEIVDLLSRLAEDQEELIAQARTALEMNRTRLPATVSASLDYVGQCLNNAKALGTLEAELEFWLSKLHTDQSASLMVAREQLVTTINLILGFMVGLLVIALYLPIFQIGAVI